MKAHEVFSLVFCGLVCAGPVSANVIGPVDDRGTLSQKAPEICRAQPELCLQPSERERLRQTTGYVYCPGGKFGNEAMASGFMVSRNYLVTTAHTFIDSEGRWREPLADCFFQNQASPSVRLKFRFDAQSFKYGQAFPVLRGQMDYAIVRLAETFTGKTEPLPIYVEGPALAVGQPILGVTAAQEDLWQKVDPNEPIIRACEIMDRDYKGDGLPSAIISDCDNTAFGSGGPNLVRKNGRLFIIGLMVGSGTKDKYLAPYSRSGQSFTFSLAFDGHLLRDLRLLAKDILSSD